MKKIAFLILFIGMSAAPLHAQKKTFVRDYTYQASEVDSKVTARTFATEQMRNILLSEVGQYLHVERTLKQDDTSEEFSQKIEAITAGIVEMKTLDEQWDGSTYYIKAEMAVDPKDLERRIAEVLNDKQKTKDLEEARKRTLAAEAEAARLRKELEATKDEQQRLTLQKTYTKAADVLSAEEYFTKGDNAYKNNFYELAIEYLQKAIDLDPNHARAYSGMGFAYFNLKNYNEVIRYCQRAVNLDPNNAWAYYNMGAAYYNLENLTEAIRYYQKAINIDPNNEWLYCAIGNTYIYNHKLGEYNKAIPYYQKAIDINPDEWTHYIQMGFAYYLLDNDREVIRCYQKAIDIGDKYAGAYLFIGQAYYNLKKYRKANRYFQKAIAIDPNDASTYYSIGLTYFDRDDDNLSKESLKYFRKAARLGYEDAQERLRKYGKKW
jgi:superkiller protein 3